LDHSAPGSFEVSWPGISARPSLPVSASISTDLAWTFADVEHLFLVHWILYSQGVNYFAHAICYLDRPNFIAGLAVPDWLSVVNRKARVRRKKVIAALEQLTAGDHEIAVGILQHLDDDQWFHGTEAFFRVTGELGRRFREVLGPEDAWRCGFLGHIVLEILIDRVLIENDPAALDRYYQVIAEVDRFEVQQLVDALATEPVPDLARFIDLYIQERFLADYVDDLRLLHRLNQVMRRVGLMPLPVEVTRVLQEGSRLVREQLPELLPAERFSSRLALGEGSEDGERPPSLAT
jgi:hypothetical protein